VVNRVTYGDYDCPRKVLNFVTDLHAAFRMLNLRNDFLRKKFDGELIIFLMTCFSVDCLPMLIGMSLSFLASWTWDPSIVLYINCGISEFESLSSQVWNMIWKELKRFTMMSRFEAWHRMGIQRETKSPSTIISDPCVNLSYWSFGSSALPVEKPARRKSLFCFQIVNCVLFWWSLVTFNLKGGQVDRFLIWLQCKSRVV